MFNLALSRHLLVLTSRSRMGSILLEGCTVTLEGKRFVILTTTQHKYSFTGRSINVAVRALLFLFLESQTPAERMGEGDKGPLRICPFDQESFQ